MNLLIKRHVSIRPSQKARFKQCWNSWHLNVLVVEDSTLTDLEGLEFSLQNDVMYNEMSWKSPDNILIYRSNLIINDMIYHIINDMIYHILK